MKLYYKIGSVMRRGVSKNNKPEFVRQNDHQMQLLNIKINKGKL